MASSVCARCGTRMVPRARYCYACGARVDVEAIDIDVYGDGPTERQAVEADASSSSLLGVLIGAAAMIALIGLGLAALGGSDDAPTGDVARADEDPEQSASEGEPVETAVAGVDEVAVVRGERLEWREGVDLAEGWPLGFAEWDGSIFLFAHSTIGPFGGLDDLAVWRLGNGSSWESLGKVFGQRSEVAAVTAGPDGLVAVGRDSEGVANVWTSTDGANWEARALPASGAEGQLPTPPAVVVNDGLIVVAGVPRASNPYAAIVEALQAVTGLDARDLDTLEYGGLPFVVTLAGPFGIPLLEMTAAELGLPDLDVRGINGGPGFSPASAVWTSTDSATWDLGADVDTFVFSLSATADGSIVMSGYGEAGAETWVSPNGKDWQRRSGPEMNNTVRWGSRTLGTTRSSSTALTVSSGGSDWQWIQLAELLPKGREWHAAAISAGAAGAAVTMYGYDPSSDESEPTTASLSKDGYMITAPARGNNLVLRADGGEVLTVRMYSHTLTESVVPNVAERTITFLDTETNEPFVTFTFDELAQLERERSGGGGFDEDQRVLFSVDGIEWSVNNPASFAGDQSLVVALHVATAQLYAAVVFFPSGAPFDGAPLTLRVFTADITANE